MTWIVAQSSIVPGILATERVDSHFRVLQRESGVLILAVNATLAVSDPASRSSELSHRILDLCEQSFDAAPGLEAIAVRLRELISRLGDDAVAWVTALWFSGDRLELWSNGRDDLIVFASERSIVQRCSPRLRLGPQVTTVHGTGQQRAEQPIESLPLATDRVRVVVLHELSNELSVVPGVIGWQHARPDTSVQDLAELTHGWMFDRGLKLDFVAALDLIHL